MIEFPLTITKSTRIFGGYEYAYMGNNLIKIPINKKLDYGSIIKLSNRNNVISSNFDETEIYFKLIEQKGNQSRRNIYMGLPLFKKDLTEGTSIIINVKHKNFRVYVPANSQKKNVLRLKNLVTKLYSDIQGDVFLTLLEKDESEVFQKNNQPESRMNSLKPEIIKNTVVETSESQPENIKDIVYAVYSEPSYRFSISIGFPYIIKLKFEKVVHGDKTIKRLM